MKTLSVSVSAYVLAFILSFAPGFSSRNNADALKKVQEYKQLNTISCGPGSTNVMSGDAFSRLPFFGWEYDFSTLETGYNTLFIPDTLSGTEFTLRMHDTSKQYLNGPATNTSSFNNNSVLGPTLIFNKGTTVQMHVQNNLTDTTTVHWHGLHLPAIMDGGPHQTIAPGVQWNPTWVVKNNAATYWYHPHLHMKTSEQLIRGLAGLIIVRDNSESALNLPRTYGVDDIPLILNDKRFEGVTNQLVLSRYGDTMTCNGTLNAQYNIPAQVVRFRLLNAAPDRAYNIGFSDNRNFSVIAGDAGLLSTPASVNRYVMSPGERIEILLNFTGQSLQNLRLRAFNASLPSDISGSDPDNSGTADFVRNKLGARDFDILRLNIVAPTSTPVTSIPSTLVANETIDSTQASVTRTLKITQANGACPDPTTRCAWINKQFFSMTRIDYSVKQDATEIWEITNNALTSHPFHIHDVSFKVLSKSTGAIPAYEKGWKDVILVRKGETIRFIAKFSDYADSTHPYMYHCHVTFHEDEGMMGQFVVTPPVSVPPTISIADVRMNEGNTGTTPMNFTVTLSAPYSLPITVNYQTKNVSATAGSDYVATSSILTFAPGETIKTITVNIIGDTYAEGNETFKITLKKPVNATLADGTAKGTILNDDAASAISRVAYNASTELIKVYPNPVTNGRLTISIAPLYKNTLHLYFADATGRMIKTQTITSNTQNITINTAGLENGIYFLSLFDGKEYVLKQKVEVLQNQ